MAPEVKEIGRFTAPGSDARSHIAVVVSAAPDHTDGALDLASQLHKRIIGIGEQVERLCGRVNDPNPTKEAGGQPPQASTLLAVLRDALTGATWLEGLVRDLDAGIGGS